MDGARKIRVLIVDDSAIVRKVLSSILDPEPDIEVVGTAPDPFIARDKILSLKPDVLTLDIEMPRMDGLTFLEKLMTHHPLPVIMISSLAQSSTRAALEAVNRGAVDVLAKPGGPYSVGDLKGDLPHRVRAAARARLRAKPGPHAPARPPAAAANPSAAREHSAPAKPVNAASPAAQPARFRNSMLLAIGASTGGTVAIEQILTQCPVETPPIVIAQHIPAGFSAAFAERLNKVCAIEVREARDGDAARTGLALVAPGNRHMRVRNTASNGWVVQLDDGPKVCYQRPSVDVLFQSVAEQAGRNAAGAILTGMGSDGADGLLAMRRAGSKTMAQDEATCVVFGMPREAIIRGGAEQTLPLGRIARALLDACKLAG
ncbi:MAG: chemotaxis response regulator protein-glutamate methylesterase [Candidatus Solibacter sp.]|nr:chemotaxis response regulator protein-glutamate methylesterase [Candidatus Solibacter sp.]